MKMVVAYVKTSKLDDVKEALKEAGVAGLTVSEARGFGRQRGHTETYRGREYQVDFVPKIRVEVLCEDGEAGGIAERIMTAARTGKIGDGKITIIPVEQVYRIRTGEMGKDAL
jgi:nitrogen regulatory protein P-II 1